MKTTERRKDVQRRVAVMEAIALRKRGQLKEGLKLLLERDVPTTIIVRTLLIEDDFGKKLI